MKALALLLTLACATTATAQQIHRIDYELAIDTAAPAAFHVSMHIADAPASFTLAAAAHPEYDDKYWHFIDHMRADRGSITRIDSVRWQVSGAGGDISVQYDVLPPAAPSLRSSWRAFITSSGALGGGPHTFLYVVGSERAAAQVHVTVPNGWRVATALPRTAENTFAATDMLTLIDSPIMAGSLSEWRFTIEGVPHDVAYLRTPQTVAFDSTAFVNAIERYAHAAVDLFGSIPYHNYTFLFEDSAYSGGLEHFNSVTMGAPSAELARNPYAVLPEVAHEFFHTWNLMAMRPIEYRGVDYRVQPPVNSLWWSEGLTLFYSDLLRRRAGLPVSDSTRLTHLQYLLASYVGAPGHNRFSAEQISRAAYNAPPGALGDYSASTHVQGEVFGNMLDLIVRDATNGTRSIDDVMRLLYTRFVSTPGFTGRDIERAVSDVCGCKVADFFESYVRDAHTLDIDRYLGLIGLRSRITWTPARGSDGQLQPDLRIRGIALDGQQGVSLLLWNPESIWVKAGLHTGDRLVAVNGKPIATWPELRAMLVALHIGDTVRIEVMRASGAFATTVTIAGWQRPVVAIEEIAGASEKQRRLRASWLAGQAPGHD